jgi:hypothetical protein
MIDAMNNAGVKGPRLLDGSEVIVGWFGKAIFSESKEKPVIWL